jgi:hypothetical protein
LIVVLLVKLPDIPVTVTEAVPELAVLLAASVNVLVLVVLAGLKVAVTPLGKPVADKPTLPLKPFTGLTVMVLVPFAPCAIVKLLGAAESVKLATGTGFTVREIVVVFVRLPDVPVIVTVAGPVAAVLLAASVKVLGLVLVALVGLNVAVTPLGRPVADTDKPTLPLKPFSGLTVIELEPLVPCTIVRPLGDAARE